MKRLRLEIALVVGLAAALGSAFALRGPGAEPHGEGSTALESPAPCWAVLDAPEVGTPSGLELEDVASTVAQIRELDFGNLPKPTYLPSEEFARRVRNSLDYPQEQAEIDSRALSELGALPPGTDLADELSDLLSEQVVGFYEPGSGDLVVEAGAQGSLDGVETLTLVHELEHALVDQALGLPDLESLGQGREDEFAAGLALVEGDATLTTEAYAARGLTLEDQLSIFLALPGADLGDVPHFLARSTAFPYIEGAEFVCDLYTRGGWQAVDAAYAEPPTTTAQILFPDRYRKGEEALDPRDPVGLQSAWKPAGRQALGAADLLFLFEAPDGDPARGLADPLERAGAWAGGELHVWVRGDDTATAMVLVQRDGSTGLCGSMTDWYAAAFPGADTVPGRPNESLASDGVGQDAVIRCTGDEVRVGIGPTIAVARTIAR